MCFVKPVATILHLIQVNQSRWWFGYSIHKEAIPPQPPNVMVPVETPSECPRQSLLPSILSKAAPLEYRSLSQAPGKTSVWMNRNDTQEGELGYQLDTSSTTDGSSDNSQSDSVGSQDVVLNNQLSSSARCPLAPWEFLGKQFQEYKQSCPFLTALQQRERLYRLLPLFLQAFEQKAGLLSIPDISVMANDLGTLLAMEIRKRISNKPAGAARISLTKFLQGEEEEMPGYQLLKTIFVLSHKDQGVLCNLTKTGLPDVFLQSLYLFLAFPPGQGTINDLQESEILVQDIFTQTMLNLCSHAQGVENLTRSSDFECLLKAAASGWDRCDMRWSDAVEMVFKVVSKTLTPGMLHYLHTFRCIPSFLQILSQRVNAVVPRVLCQVTVILLSFLSQSCVLSPYLLQDFENTQGYPLMLKILMRCEGDTTVKEGGGQHLDELFTLLTSLVVFGKSEVKVSGQVSHPQLPGFSLGRTTDSSKTVKNLQAFQVLQSAFQNSKDAHLCGKVLSSMQSLWTLENINFFLLEWSLQPISQFVEILPLKPPSVQNQFFQLIQFVVSELSYIPHKILQKVQELIKQNPSPSCTLAALILLQNITPIDSLFSDLFRDSGLLGMLLTQLRNHAKIIRRRVANIAPEVEGECEREITIRRLQTVGVLLQASVRNVVILKDYGMIPYIKIFLDDMGFRRGALCILEHISAVDPDEYMSTIIGALCSSTQAEVILKLDLLQSLHRILRSPREQTSFRNAAGFDVLLSVLSDMEGCLGDPPEGCWSEVQPVHIFGLIRSTLSAMTAALCHNVTNQHFVQSQGIFQKLADGLMHLGCFSPPLTPYTYKNNAEVSSRARTLQDLLSLVLSSQTDCPQSLRSCFMILSILLGMAAGTLNQVGQDHATKQITVELPMRDVQGFSEGQKDLQGELQELIQYLLPRNSDSCPQEELVTLEPGALCAVISLIQNTYSKDNQELSKEIQCVILEHIQTMGQSERRRQVLCDSQLLNCVVKYCRKSLMDHGDPLRLPLVRLFEKLAFQAVRPDVLRQFLCCGITVQQNNIQETLTDAQASVHSLHLSPGSVLHTSVSLVSMTSPRRFQTGSASMSPSFVEFDMSTHGSGCLFLPTIGTILGSNVNEILSGGVGAGARNFPPPGGLSFTCWFLVSKLCLAPEPHPVRFLTIIRHMSRSQQHFVCLSIMLNAAEHSLLISTEEREFQPLDMMEVELSPCSSPCHLSQVRLNVSGLIVTEHWHHLSVVLKEVKRSCVVNAWIDGQLLGSAEMRYVQRLPGGSSSLDPSSLVDIHAFLGTPQMWQQQSSLLWRLGFSYLFEEVLSEETLRLIHRLGPSYCGNFKHGAISTLLSEDKCVFGINGLSSCISTVSQIRDLYNEVDGRHIAKELGISSRDNSTPIFLSRNLALHLPGSSRTLGAVTIQSKGVRVFHSSPAADTLNYIGGPAVLLSLISMATDDQALYAAIKALVSVMSSSLLADVLMQQMDGYRLLAFLLKEKSYLLNPRIFQLILTITGTADLGVGPVRPLNLCAVRHILCDFQLWLEVPGDLDLSLLNHLVEVLRGLRNTEIIQQLQLVPRLVFLLSDPHVVQTKVTLICTLLRHCLSNSFNRRDISMLGLFLVSTLPATSVDEKQLHPQDPSLEAGDALQQGLSEKISTVSERMIWLRNQLLSVLIEVMCPPSSCLSEQQQETVLVTLGADWFLLFIQPSLHLSSLLLGMRLVGHLLQNQTLLSNFREVTKAGACVQHSTYELHILMDNIRSNDTFPTCNFPLVSGFTCLLETIHHHKEQPEIYLFLFSVFLRAPQDEGSAERQTLLPLLFVVLKKDSSYRNKYVMTTYFKMESLHSIIETMCQGEYLASLDLQDAYLHIPILPDSQHYLQFACGSDHYQFTALSFGLVSVPWVFTRVMGALAAFIHARGISMTSHLDDILLKAPSEELLTQHIQDGAQLLVHHGWILNMLKSCPGDMGTKLQDLLQNHSVEQILQIGLCKDAALLLLTMVKATLCQESEDRSRALIYCNTAMQFLCRIYHNYPSDALWTTADFINTLASLLLQPMGQGVEKCRLFNGTIQTLLDKEVLELVPVLEMGSGFYSNLFRLVFLGRLFDTKQAMVFLTNEVAHQIIHKVSAVLTYDPVLDKKLTSLDSGHPEVDEEHSGTKETIGGKKEHHINSTRKPVQELLNCILRQSLTQHSALKQDHPLEHLLEVFPVNVSIEQKNRFQTEILQCTMEMFLAISHWGELQNDELCGELRHDSLGCTSGTEILEEVAIANLSYFSQKLLEKMLCGGFTADPCKILLFFIKQITAVTHTTAPCNRDSLFTMMYGYLNRSILHCLSRPRQTLMEVRNVLKTLELLLSHWDVIFTTYNSSLSFAACLMHCLFQIYSGSYPEGFGVKSKAHSSWQLIFLSKDEEDEQVDGPDMQEVLVQVLHAVQTVWEQLMVYRRQILEEHYKMDLSVKQGEGQISQVTPLWEETASKAWQQYLASEKKNLKSKNKVSASPGQRITAAVRGLYGGIEPEVECKAQDTAFSLDLYRRQVQDVFKCLFRDHQQMQQCRHMAASRDWSALEKELFSEGGVWESLWSQNNQSWEINPCEDPWRTRKRIQPVLRKLETKVLQKIMIDGATAILVALYWTRREWFEDLGATNKKELGAAVTCATKGQEAKGELQTEVSRSHSFIRDIKSIANEFKKEIKELGERTTRMEDKVDKIIDSHNALSDRHSELLKEVQFLRPKVNDLEDRSRRNNIRIRGIPEDIQPTSLKDWFVRKMVSKFDSQVQGSLIVCGVFNVVSDPKMDTTAKTSPIYLNALKSQGGMLQQTLRESGLYDVWRVLHPLEKDYTFYSHVHLCYSRLDYFCVDKSLLQRVQSCNISVIQWSDHAPSVLEILESFDNRGSGSWRLNDHLLSCLDTVRLFEGYLREYFDLNGGEAVSLSTLWEAHKAVIQGRFIAYAAKEKKKRAERLSTLSSELMSLETLQKRGVTTKRTRRINAIKQEISDIQLFRTQLMLRRLKQTYYTQGNRAGALLAKRLRKKEAKKAIPFVLSPSGDKIMNPSQIPEAFAQYYAKLYNLHLDSNTLQPSQQEIDNFLDEVHLPSLSPAQSATLQSPISAEEVQLVIGKLPIHKAPGPDGFSNIYYKKFSSILVPHLVDLFTYCGGEGSFPSSMLSAHISALPKPGKSPTQCSNFRPISLLNTDVKIYAKVLANRLQDLLPSLLHYDQVGFVRGRQASDNTRKMVDLIQAAHSSNTECLLLAIDAEKAFDRIHWGYLRKVLERFQFPSPFIEAVFSLYSIPTARVSYAGFLSRPFNLSNGSRQGCPVSPILYVLALEPLAEAIRSQPLIKGYSFRESVEVKLGLFADNIIIALTDPVNSLPPLMELLQRYSKISYHKVNHMKTQALPLNMCKAMLAQLRMAYSFEWRRDTLTYLGISLTSHPEALYTANFKRLTILQEFPEKEKISLKMPVVLVEGHVILEGVLLFGRDHFYLCPDFILSSSGDITCRMHGVSSIEDPFIHDLCYKDITSLSPSKTNGMSDSTDGEKPESPYRKSMPVIPRSECYSYQEVLDLQSMYFLMQEIALEIFFKNRISKFIVFPNKDVNVAIKWFHSLMPSLKVKSAGEDPQNIRSSAGEKLMLQKWQRREVGNFEYLMFLNSLSGRTIRDLMQYPLMPWVLQDYKSETLDLSDPKVFRDLSKPMGAQSPGRSQKFIQRYQDVEKNDGELSMQCHYCTHYSSASIVSSYLVRVEPFTQAMQYLQGGSLDLADRLFHSVAGAWESASTENMSDVRELIPEFFYLPEMFTNCNNCQLGCMQDGTVVGDVILPPWARGDPHTFVRLHREALESEYVSSHLHHWIDLMFGYKQRGPAAVQALNVFHPYFYGSPAHLNSTDPLVRSTLIGYISNFGQVPKQLFTKPHPPRQGKELSTGHLATPFYSAPSCLKHVIVTPRAGALHGAVGQMVLTDKGVFAVEKNHVMLLPSCTMSLSWGHSDGSIKLQTRSTRKVLGVWELMSHWGLCHCIVCPISTLVVTAMSSSVLCAWEFRPPGPKYQAAEIKLKKVLIGHGSAVLCVCASAQNSVMVSGSTDGSCIIWDLDKLNCFKRLPTHPGEVTCVTISDSTGAIISCCSSALYVWSVNGDPISYVCTGSNILSCCFGGLSVIIIGSEDGAVSLWKMETAGDQKVEGLGGKMLGTSLQMFHRLTSSIPATGKQQRPAAVTALAISRNYTKLLVGDERGVITSWHLD
ncbi:WD repeat- and FYVE domain-containing protein 4 [Rhinophrynus dorsalis]